MIPANPYVFAALTVVLAVVPIVQAGAPDVALPPWLLLLVAVVNVACATILRMMQTDPVPIPGSEVDQLIERLEALPKDARDEMTTRLEWRARLRGEG